MNAVHPTIKYTAASSPTEMDILIKVRNGLLHTHLHTKPTDTHNYLHYLSAHPRHCKDNIPFSQFLRVRRLCSQDEDFRARCLELTQHLRERDDPTDIITTALQRVKQLPRAKTLQYKPRANTHRVPFIITYNSRSPLLRHWFQELLPHLHSSTRIQQAFLSRPFSENAIAAPSKICSSPRRCPSRQMTTKTQGALLVERPAVWYVPAISSRPRHSPVPPLQKRSL